MPEIATNLVLWLGETALDIIPLNQVDARISAPFITMGQLHPSPAKGP